MGHVVNQLRKACVCWCLVSSVKSVSKQAIWWWEPFKFKIPFVCQHLSWLEWRKWSSGQWSFVSGNRDVNSRQACSSQILSICQIQPKLLQIHWQQCYMWVGMEKLHTALANPDWLRYKLELGLRAVLTTQEAHRTVAMRVELQYTAL